MTIKTKAVSYLLVGAALIGEFLNPLNSIVAYGESETADPWSRPSVVAMEKANLLPESVVNVNKKKEMTRLEFAELVTTYFVKVRPQGELGESKFTDTKSPLVGLAAELGIVYGKSATEFAPNEKVTREQVAAMVHRAEEQLNKLEGRKSDFVDKGKISDYAKEAVEELAYAKVINGYPDGTFKPKNNITVQEGIVLMSGLAKGHGLVEQGSGTVVTPPVSEVRPGTEIQLSQAIEMMRPFTTEGVGSKTLLDTWSSDKYIKKVVYLGKSDLPYSFVDEYERRVALDSIEIVPFGNNQSKCEVKGGGMIGSAVGFDTGYFFPTNAVIPFKDSPEHAKLAYVTLDDTTLLVIDLTK